MEKTKDLDENNFEKVNLDRKHIKMVGRESYSILQLLRES
jgi:hypothetical protein